MWNVRAGCRACHRYHHQTEAFCPTSARYMSNATGIVSLQAICTLLSPLSG